MHSFWDKRFSQGEAVYGTAPNDFFAGELAKLAAGKILLPAEGQGRNAVYAAGLGWQVQAFDPSEVAREQALKLAAAQQVSMDYQLAAYESFQAPSASFDALALVFAHMPGQHRRNWHRRLLSYLRPGGMLILQGFAKAQLGLASGGPKDSAMLFSSAEIREDFGEMAYLEVKKSQAILDEGAYHQGFAQVISAIGQK